MHRRHHFVFNAASLYRIGCLDNSVKAAETMPSYRDLSNHLKYGRRRYDFGHQHAQLGD